MLGYRVHELFHFFSIKAADAAPDLISITVEQDEGGRCQESIFLCQYFPDSVLNVHPLDDQTIFEIALNPIHDGFHCDAAYSKWGLEL